MSRDSRYYYQGQNCSFYYACHTFLVTSQFNHSFVLVTNGHHQMVPDDIANEAEALAKVTNQIVFLIRDFANHFR